MNYIILNSLYSSRAFANSALITVMSFFASPPTYLVQNRIKYIRILLPPSNPGIKGERNKASQLPFMHVGVGIRMHVGVRVGKQCLLG